MTSVTVEDTSQKAHFYLIEYQNDPNSNNVYLVVYISIGFVGFVGFVPLYASPRAYKSEFSVPVISSS